MDQFNWCFVRRKFDTCTIFYYSQKLILLLLFRLIWLLIKHKQCYFIYFVKIDIFRMIATNVSL